MVNRVRCKSNGAILCRKEIKYKGKLEEHELIENEIRILRSLEHPNIARYHGMDHAKNIETVYIYMEYCGKGDLKGLIDKRKQARNR